MLKDEAKFSTNCSVIKSDSTIGFTFTNVGHHPASNVNLLVYEFNDNVTYHVGKPQWVFPIDIPPGGSYPFEFFPIDRKYYGTTMYIYMRIKYIDEISQNRDSFFVGGFYNLNNKANNNELNMLTLNETIVMKTVIDSLIRIKKLPAEK